MRLEKIKLAGFKSFVDPTTVLFPSNLVGVVGPNGCGKSNVVDAIKWVMGEQSARKLRGKGMDDVISIEPTYAEAAPGVVTDAAAAEARETRDRLWQAHRTALDAAGATEYWQAGRSVAGIHDILPAKQVIERLVAELETAQKEA